MKSIVVIDRKTEKKEKEKIMSLSLITFLYGSSFISKVFAPIMRLVLCKFHVVSKLCGIYQRSSISKKTILPFIKNYNVDTSEFAQPAESFESFNDFFIRKLQPGSRPIEKNPKVAVCPADGRYLSFQNIDSIKKFWIKGRHFSLQAFLQNPKLEKLFEGGSMVIARLCPSDYHRFHFPVSGIASKSSLINGALFSVNPIALFKNFLIIQENKRAITIIDSDYFGKVAFVEIGATNVGSIIQTYKPGTHIIKGEEKGYFSFGGSCVVILFEKGKIKLDTDICENTLKGFETKTSMGQSLGSIQD